MPTPEEIFMAAFSEELESSTTEEAPEMPVLSKLAENLGLMEDGEEEVEMPVLSKLAAAFEGDETDEDEESAELSLEGMTQLEKLAFTKWAARNGLTKEALSMAELKDKGKALVEKGKSTLKGKDWTAAEKKLESAKAQKPKSFRLFSKRKAKAGVAAAEKGVAAAKGKRMALGKKVGLGAAGGAAALLTAAAVKKALGDRKKDEKKK